MLSLRTTSPRRQAEIEVKGRFADDVALERAAAWARETLTAAGHDPSTTTVRGIKALREADRTLSLVAARYLADLAASTSRRGA